MDEQKVKPIVPKPIGNNMTYRKEGLWTDNELTILWITFWLIIGIPSALRVLGWI